MYGLYCACIGFFQTYFQNISLLYVKFHFLEIPP